VNFRTCVKGGVMQSRAMSFVEAVANVIIGHILALITQLVVFPSFGIRTTLSEKFTDRLFALRQREPTGQHEFDQLCAELDIEHRLTKPRSPQTNGMVERFNGRIADVLKTNRFVSGEDLEQTIMRYVALYNTQLPQAALGSRTPVQAMKHWHKSNPDLFLKKPSNRPGCDSYGWPSVCPRLSFSQRSSFAHSRSFFSVSMLRTSAKVS
jgi:hypothetical protein